MSAFIILAVDILIGPLIGLVVLCKTPLVLIPPASIALVFLGPFALVIGFIPALMGSVLQLALLITMRWIRRLKPFALSRAEFIVVVGICGTLSGIISAYVLHHGIPSPNIRDFHRHFIFGVPGCVCSLLTYRYAGELVGLHYEKLVWQSHCLVPMYRIAAMTTIAAAIMYGILSLLIMKRTFSQNISPRPPIPLTSGVRFQGHLSGIN